MPQDHETDANEALRSVFQAGLDAEIEHARNTYLPEIWTDVARKKTDDVSILMHIAQQGPGRVVVTEHEPLYLLERQVFARAYTALLEEGIEMGFLIFEGCMECGGPAQLDTSMSVSNWVLDEAGL